MCHISALFHFKGLQTRRGWELLFICNDYCFCCSSVGRTLEEFKTSVTVAAHKKITFELTYEELLKRRLGKYELQIHARPMQPVKDFKVGLSCWYSIYSVTIQENNVGIIFIIFHCQNF